MPLTQILGQRVREIAEANWLVQPGDGVKVSEVKKRLRAAGITTGSARLHELTEPGLRKQPEIRRAVHRWLHAKIYAKLGRDFSLSFSFPEYAEMPGGKRLPNFLVWDKPHGVKNGRMASANDLKHSDRAAVDTATAAPDGEADGEGELFGDDLTTTEDVEDALGGGGVAAAAGTLAHGVGLAARAVIG